MRALRKEELNLIVFILENNLAYNDIKTILLKASVQEMEDGGMGSLKFLYFDGKTRVFGKEIANVSILDIDGVPVSYAINVDDFGDIYELDVFKADFSALKQFPTSPYEVLPSAETL